MDGRKWMVGYCVLDGMFDELYIGDWIRRYERAHTMLMICEWVVDIMSTDY